ncbi:MAG: hypothetical protein HY892_13115 [Deltaproteobacteria bacterium]|nr:hypothetical protein [Deltaproteobacteria bacterium]
MAEILCFSRNRCTTVEAVDDRITRSISRVQDTATEAEVEILVQAPDLEIIAIRGAVQRSAAGETRDFSAELRPVIGARVGPGIKKIIRGLLGETPLLETWTALLEECCNGVIMVFTKEVLLQAPKDRDGERDFFLTMVRANPRLYNSCAALAADSPLMAGLETGISGK